MADLRICSVEGCGKAALPCRKGFCGAHYKRQYRNGDPKGVRKMRAADGEPLAWLKDNINYDGNDCLKWPYADRGNGYGAVNNEHGKTVGAHRMMCELAHGDPPSYRHIVCHSCGNGHLGCVNPRHLRWGTVSDNSRDMIGHGTALRGNKNGSSKLKEEDAREIRRMRGRETQVSLAMRFGVSQSVVSKIQLGEAWAWMDYI